MNIQREDGDGRLTGILILTASVMVLIFAIKSLLSGGSTQQTKIFNIATMAIALISIYLSMPGRSE